MTDDLTLLTNGQAFTGWQAISVNRSVEATPNSFVIAATDNAPRAAAKLFVSPGDTCQVKLGNDLVLTGYIDQVEIDVSAEAHTLKVTGRGKCQDLVDCAAQLPSMSLSAASVLQLAQDLAKPFGITVSALSGNGPVIPAFTVTLGMTPYEIIEETARYSALLAYEGNDGNLILSKVGSTEMASGCVEGANVQAEKIVFSINERFSEYRVFLQSIDKLANGGESGNLFGFSEDKAVPRFRPRFIISEQSQNGQYLAQQRADWEMQRRRGRSQVARITVDSWRDSAGNLWQPNALAPLNLPACKLVDLKWVIVDVVFRRDMDGTHAELLLMAPEALTTEPSALNLFDWQIGQALANGRNGPPPPDPGRV